MPIVLLIFLLSRLFLFAATPFTEYTGEMLGLQIKVGTWLGVSNEFLNTWTAFDSESYLHISENGYELTKNTAFFPLYPLLIKGLSHLGLSSEWAGFLISFFSFLVALVLIQKILKKLGKDNYALWLLAFSPISVFFTAVYTESLFLLLTALMFILVLDKKWFWAGCVAGLASLTRNSGIILFLVIAIEMWSEYPSYKIYLQNLIVKNAAGVFLFTLFPLYLWIDYGNPLKYITVQSELWNRHFTLPWKTVWMDMQTILQEPSSHIIAILNLVFLALVLWMVWNWKKQRISFTVFVLLSSLMPILSPPIQSDLPYTTGFNRYFLVLFPLYIFLGDKIKNKYCRIIVLILSLLISLYFLTLFSGKQFIG